MRYVVPLADFALIRRFAPPSPPGGRLFSGVRYRSVMPLNKGDPACWRPAWGGVRLCGNGWWESLIFGGWCRYDEVICSEMTRGGQGREAKNKMPYQLVSLCYISLQTNYVSRPCPPTCHPERSGTTRQKSRAPTNHCRAVEPRPKRGASRRDLAC